MAKLNTEKHAIVQHSAFGYGEDYTFKNGLEIRRLTTEAELGMVINIGGKVFDTYSKADDYATKEMYPGDYQGMVPKAPGKFSDKKIDDLAIYIPPSS